MNEKIICKSEFETKIKTFLVSLCLFFMGMAFMMILFFVKFEGEDADSFLVPGLIFLILGIVTLIIFFAVSKSELTVTENRVYGKGAFGKRVDLPISQISAVAVGMFKSIAVATSSGKVSFFLIANRDELFSAISELLVKRQNDTRISNVAQAAPAPSSSAAEELKKYKELLDSGVITQEEFNAKKKQLLGL